jgi:two-component system CheB/CheR fusion protein
MKNQQYIVAIGASAGGLEALSSFFDHTPLDSVSYIVIPHLSIDLKSRMVEILSRHSDLEVMEAQEGMLVEVNKVYLIPNNKYMGIVDGRLTLTAKEGHAIPYMTIDSFFTSLAEERGPKAIGIVLSGVGNDGSRGAKAIEEAGGMIMIQTPEDAKFDGMPMAAIEVCKSSYILPAQALPDRIQEYIKDEINSGADVKNELDESVLVKILNLIREHYPFDFTNYKIGTLSRRIKRRMVHHNLEDETDFYQYLKHNPEEIESLIIDFLIGVTSFFRDPQAFLVLRNEVIPKIILQKSENDLLKVWVACCATGEEAYSLAILIKEYLIKHKIELDVKIFATDINEKALSVATKGVYSTGIAKDVAPDRLANFFDKINDQYKIKPEIREMLIFARHDLTKHPPYCYIDLVTCRNMLIYIKPVLQKQILLKLGFGLRKDGYLFLGSSENLSIAKNEFVEVSAQWKIYQNKQSNRIYQLDGQITAPILDFNYKSLQKKIRPQERIVKDVVTADMTTLILAESGFCGVAIDQDNKVIQAFGDLSPFLKPERFILNLKELLPERLSIAYSVSVEKVLRYNQRVRINDVAFSDPRSGQANVTDIIISPYFDGKNKTKGLLVLFKIAGQLQAEGFTGTDFQIDVQTKEYIDQLEEDLVQAKMDLHTSSEFLETSKETMQSFNEELLSANEEMQSANEELQSINEELEAVNVAYKLSINELTTLNDDLNNYFRSNTNGQLFVDNDILLKKFSPGMVKHINIQESDLGRPLSNITTNIKLETLINDIKEVIQTGEVIVKDVESIDGKLYQVTTSPYLRNNGTESYGAIITFYDITKLKKAQYELFKSTEMLRLATESANMATWSINIKTRELLGSERLKDLFGMRPDDELNLDDVLSRILMPQRALMRDLIETAIRKETVFEFEFPIDLKENKAVRWIKLVGNVTHQSIEKSGDLTGVMYDITEQKRDDIRKKDFIALASHELKSPLTSVKGYLQILTKKANSTADTFSSNTLERATKQVNKMSVLIDGFLNLSRLDNGKIHLLKEKFKIDLLIKDIVEDSTAANLNHTIMFDTECGLEIFADRNKIGQVVSNLISNAVKYSPERTTIKLTCMQVNHMLQVNVQDEGMGIKQEDQAKLFNRYFRTENVTTERIAGFGLGLYLCAEIIAEHNGQIAVESEIGKGSTFSFTVPLSI